jgi:hypothetical protein
MCAGVGVNCIRLKLTSIYFEITEKKSCSKNVPEIPTKYGKERCTNRFKLQTRILLSDEMLSLGGCSAILHRETKRLPIKSRFITGVLLFVNIYSKIAVILYLLSCV